MDSTFFYNCILHISKGSPSGTGNRQSLQGRISTWWPQMNSCRKTSQTHRWKEQCSFCIFGLWHNVLLLFVLWMSFLEINSSAFTEYTMHVTCHLSTEIAYTYTVYILICCQNLSVYLLKSSFYCSEEWPIWSCSWVNLRRRMQGYIKIWRTAMLCLLQPK